MIEISFRARAALVVSLALILPHETRTTLAQDRLPQADGGGTSDAGEALVLVIGAAGAEEYLDEFTAWGERWQQLAQRRHWQLTVVGPLDPESTDSQKERLQAALIERASDCSRLWVVLLGHGTFSRNEAKFNLTGTDVSAKEMKAWLQEVDAPMVIINCSSSSAPFLTELAGRDRVLLTATRSGSELNFSRFGKFLSLAINDAEADIDHDQEVSLLEAFLAATSRTERFFREDARLTTEHALLDDNGDRIGTSADFYRGVRPVKEAQAGKSIDGTIAGRIILYSSPTAPIFTPELEARRAEIENRIDLLRRRKSQLVDEDYFAQLEALLLELATIYDQVEDAAGE